MGSSGAASCRAVGNQEDKRKALNRPLLVIAGPTGSGKNRIALEIARDHPCEIVNADSRQIYRDLVIGTNQPTKEQMRMASHHLYGFLEPAESFSGADYERLATPVIDLILSRRRLPLVVGGTGFYMKALLHGVWPVGPKNEELRTRFRRIEHQRGRLFLHRMLQRLDPHSASKIASNDVYRVIRSLEILAQTGIRRSELPSENQEKFQAWKFYLDLDRQAIHKNIRERTQKMFQDGWVEEVKQLLQRYPEFEYLPAAAALGYREIVRYLKGEMDLESCKERIILRTNQYAKRQLTWFRNQDGFQPFPSLEQVGKIIQSVLQWEGDL